MRLSGLWPFLSGWFKMVRVLDKAEMLQNNSKPPVCQPVSLLDLTPQKKKNNLQHTLCLVAIGHLLARSRRVSAGSVAASDVGRQCRRPGHARDCREIMSIGLLLGYCIFKLRKTLGILDPDFLPSKNHGCLMNVFPVNGPATLGKCHRDHG